MDQLPGLLVESRWHFQSRRFSSYDDLGGVPHLTQLGGMPRYYQEITIPFHSYLGRTYCGLYWLSIPWIGRISHCPTHTLAGSRDRCNLIYMENDEAMALL